MLKQKKNAFEKMCEDWFLTQVVPSVFTIEHLFKIEINLQLVVKEKNYRMTILYR